MQAMKSGAETLGAPWLLPLMAVCLFFGAVGQVNSWLVGPIYMLQEASREDKILGENVAKLHPKYGTPAFALIIQAVIVSILCLSTFISPSVAAAYWMLTALTTICYFIPYLVMFPSFIRLQPDPAECASLLPHPRKDPAHRFASAWLVLDLLCCGSRLHSAG